MIENIKYNPKERCYICKKYMFSMLKTMAENDGCDTIIEGSNYDDRKDFRPGFKAVQEAGALKQADLDYNKPSFACYFSRFPYNIEISKEMIEIISKSECYIHSLGFNSVRVRYHNQTARIEASENHIKDIINNKEIRSKIITYLKSLGFIFVCMDLEEYKTGSMNRLI